MNGKKVLNRLINLFIVINIVLLIINCVSKRNEYILSQERISNIIKLLGQSGIEVKAELIRDYSPKSAADLVFIGDSVAVRNHVVKKFFGNDFKDVKRSTATSSKTQGRSVFYYTLGEETLAFDHDELIYENEGIGMDETRPELETAKSMCNQLISRMDFGQQDLTYRITEEAYDTYWKLTYYPVIEEMPLLDSYMEFIVGSSGVITASMYLADVEVQNNSKQNIYAIDLVLFEIEDYMIEHGYTTIEEITLCYKREKNEENVLGQQIIPAYKIKMSGLDDAIFVNAYTNQILE